MYPSYASSMLCRLIVDNTINRPPNSLLNYFAAITLLGIYSTILLRSYWCCDVVGPNGLPNADTRIVVGAKIPFMTDNKTTYNTNHEIFEYRNTDLVPKINVQTLSFLGSRLVMRDLNTTSGIDFD